ncbi:MAG: NEW3 domain-containing protein, partial [Lysobacter sp.]
AKTRILGNSAAPPKLWGAERTWSILNLNGSSNVEVGHLEITDKSNCVSAHSVASAACNRTSAPYGNWASVGLSASNSGNVWLHDVNIHGLGLHGMNAGGLSNWTMERVKINHNGWAGWDANVGTNSSNSGAIVMRDIEIAWNGCGQDWQTGAAVNCWGQKSGGYGDGLGTITTGGQWLIEDAFVHHNTSDGLDLLYMDGAAGTTVTIRRAYAIANGGNQIKTRGNATIENSVMVGSCAYFAGKFYMQAGDQCRASGNALSISVGSNNNVNIRHNTITGQGDGLIMTTEGDSSSKITIQNNALLGMPDYLAGVAGSNQLAVAHFAYNSAATVSFAGNLIWNVKNDQCPSGSICGQNPNLTNMTLASFDGLPKAGSPVVDKVAMLGGMGTDFLMQPRPSGSASDIGALELQAGGTTPPPPPPPSPTCTRAAPAISLTGPTAAVVAGTNVTYTVSLTNKDSSACANTSFNLARTVPANWTGTLSASSVTLAPGASANATLNVKSVSSATAGGYGIGAGVSSTAGSTHTASAASTYTVASDTTPPPATGLTESVGTDKASYIGGETVYMSARVLNNGQPVAGATVKFTATKPNGIKIVKSATSGADGYARKSFVSGTGSSSMGTYQLSALATSNGSSVTANSTFTVSKTATTPPPAPSPEPTPEPTPAPTGLVETVGTDKASYIGGQTVTMSARVLKNGVAVSGATVKFTATKPDGYTTIVMSTTTGSDGYARKSFNSGTGGSSMGTYQLKALATSSGTSVTATNSFKVSRY